MKGNMSGITDWIDHVEKRIGDLNAKVAALEKMFEHHPQPPRTADEATVKQWEQHHKPSPPEAGTQEGIECHVCGKMSSQCAAEEGDGGWWCEECRNKWEQENGAHWEDGSPLKKQPPPPAPTEAQQEQPSIRATESIFAGRENALAKWLAKDHKLRPVQDIKTELRYAFRSGFEAALTEPAAELSRLRDLVRWRDAEKEKPPINEIVIVDGGLALWRGQRWESMTGFDSGRVIEWKVTHWMELPLPPLPKEAK